MSIVITSGGTAGHISPALAVAAELKQRGQEVLFAGSVGGMEERLVRDAGLPYHAFKAKGFDRSRPWTLLTSSLILARSTGEARSWLREVDADAVAAFGGYASVPVGRAAKREGIPLLIHEQNSAMGWTNRHLSSSAEVVALTSEAAAESLSPEARSRVLITGNPVRPAFAALRDPEQAAALRARTRQELGIAADALVLLVFGGSQGARHINEAVVQLAPKLLTRPQLSVIQLTGRKEFASVQSTLAEALGSSLKDDPAAPQRWKLLDYCDDMPGAFAAADIVLSRAGASSLAELAVAAKPALLIPFPYATADHQRKNAIALVEAGSARMVLDAELDNSAVFSDALLTLIDDVTLRAGMLVAAQNLAQTDATAKVADLVERIALSR
jgi:UDP-N-acetylglucosamine--N-acetylmuramyl-(pentapeptide) pyrophosphoryl-undecaprenol N-acetylglucosamine transferase